MILLLSPGLHSWYALPLGSGCSGCSGPPGYTMLYTCLPLVSYSPAWPGNLSLEKQDQERDANEIRALAVFFLSGWVRQHLLGWRKAVFQSRNVIPLYLVVNRDSKNLILTIQNIVRTIINQQEFWTVFMWGHYNLPVYRLISDIYIIYIHTQ